MRIRTLAIFLLLGLFALILSCDSGSNSPTEPEPSVKEDSGIVIKSEENIDKKYIDGYNIDGGSYCCTLYVTVQNTTQQIKNASLTYNAFDATGAGIAIADVWVRCPANSTSTFYTVWTVPGRPYYCISCSRFASFKLMESKIY